MANLKLPPPPTDDDPKGPAFRDWFYKLSQFLSNNVFGTVSSVDVSGGTTGLTTTGGPITTTGTITIDGTLNGESGGTGIASYTAGDILYATGTTTLAKLAIGVNGEVLTIVGGLPNWEPATSGTVTSFSFTDANGVSGVVTNPTTTPDLTITLGNITPSSVAAVGTVTGSNLSGTNTGDQFLFGTIAVSGQSNVVAETTNDTLTIVAGTNITITTDAATDSITINSSGGSSVGAEIYAFAARHG